MFACYLPILLRILLVGKFNKCKVIKGSNFRKNAESQSEVKAKHREVFNFRGEFSFRGKKTFRLEPRPQTRRLIFFDSKSFSEPGSRTVGNSVGKKVRSLLATTRKILAKRRRKRSFLLAEWRLFFLENDRNRGEELNPTCCNNDSTNVNGGGVN